MTKHLIDTHRVSLNSRLARFTEIQRNTAPHVSTKTLVVRARTQPDHRLAAYTRIARGQQA